MPFVLLGGLSSGFFPPPPGGGFFPPPPAPVFLPPLPLPPREILALGILGGRRAGAAGGKSRKLGGASRGVQARGRVLGGAAGGRRAAGSLAALEVRRAGWGRGRCRRRRSGTKAAAAAAAAGGRSWRCTWRGRPRPRTSCLAGVTESNVKSQKSAALELPPKKAELPVSYFPQKIKNVRKMLPHDI